MPVWRVTAQGWRLPRFFRFMSPLRRGIICSTKRPAQRNCPWVRFAGLGIISDACFIHTPAPSAQHSTAGLVNWVKDPETWHRHQKIIKVAYIKNNYFVEAYSEHQELCVRSQWQSFKFAPQYSIRFDYYLIWSSSTDTRQVSYFPFVIDWASFIFLYYFNNTWIDLFFCDGISKYLFLCLSAATGVGVIVSERGASTLAAAAGGVLILVVLWK